MPYTNSLQNSQEKIKEKAKKEGENYLEKIIKLVEEKESHIQEICSEDPLKYDALLLAQDDLDLAYRRKKQMQKILEDLFGEQE